MSGASNVTYWLKQRGIEPTRPLVDAVLSAAKSSHHILSDDEVMAIVRSHIAT
jgi:2-isopropylmalate synthase